MPLQPKRAGTHTGVDAGLLPPSGFIATAMDLSVMAAAERYGELIAHLAPERAVLREPQVVGIRWSSAANQAGLLGNRFDVVSLPNPARLREGQQTFISHLGAPPIVWLARIRIAWQLVG